MTVAATRSPTGVAIAGIKHSRDSGGDLSWAHASGWSQTSGRVRTVSCVVATHNAAARLAHLLPTLSDRLTESGFPWEITCVDAASTDGTAALLTSWTEFPGFGWMRLERPCSEVAAAHAGLTHARGDAVILLRAGVSDHSVDLVPSMIAKWDEGNEVVFVGSARPDAPDPLVCWTPERHRTAGLGDEPARIAMRFGEVLLDRRMVKLLLHPEAR